MCVKTPSLGSPRACVPLITHGSSAHCLPILRISLSKACFPSFLSYNSFYFLSSFHSLFPALPFGHTNLSFPLSEHDRWRSSQPAGVAIVS